MFQITKDPSSGSLTQYLAEITRMDLSCPSLTWTRSVLWQHSILPVVRVCSSLYRKALTTVNYINTPWSEYAAITPTLSMSTDTIKPFL